jgi:hypothetical protein
MRGKPLGEGFKQQAASWPPVFFINLIGVLKLINGFLVL